MFEKFLISVRIVPSLQLVHFFRFLTHCSQYLCSQLNEAEFSFNVDLLKNIKKIDQKLGKWNRKNKI